MAILLLHQKEKASMCNCVFILFQALNLNLSQYPAYILPGCLTVNILIILTSVLQKMVCIKNEVTALLISYIAGFTHKLYCLSLSGI